jgi:hypothetical protein
MLQRTMRWWAPKPKGTVRVPHGLVETIFGTVSYAIIATDAQALSAFGILGRFGYLALRRGKRSGVPSI